MIRRHKWLLIVAAGLAGLAYLAFWRKPATGANAGLVDNIAKGIQGAIAGFTGTVAEQVAALEEASQAEKESAPAFDPYNPQLTREQLAQALTEGKAYGINSGQAGVGLNGKTYYWWSTSKEITVL